MTAAPGPEPVPEQQDNDSTELRFATMGDILVELGRRYGAGVLAVTAGVGEKEAVDFELFRWGTHTQCVGVSHLARQALTIEAIANGAQGHIYGLDEGEPTDE